MTTKQINALVDQVNRIETPASIAEIRLTPCDNDGSICSDNRMQAALDENTLWLSLDIFAYRTFSAEEEQQRDNDRDRIIASIEKLPGVASVIQDGSADHLDYGHGPTYRVNLATPTWTILNEHRGDYVTRVTWQDDGSPEVHGTSDPAKATTFTLPEAESLAAALGRGFSIQKYIWNATPVGLHRVMSACGPELRGRYTSDAGEEFQVVAGVDGSWINVIDAKREHVGFQKNATGWHETGYLRVLDRLTDEDCESILESVEEATK
jgi:hypothetical protein